MCGGRNPSTRLLPLFYFPPNLRSVASFLIVSTAGTTFSNEIEICLSTAVCCSVRSSASLRSKLIIASFRASALRDALRREDVEQRRVVAALLSRLPQPHADDDVRLVLDERAGRGMRVVREDVLPK